jgi:hypothetical protein
MIHVRNGRKEEKKKTLTDIAVLPIIELCPLVEPAEIGVG